MTPQSRHTDWKTWALGVLLMIAMAASGATYQSITTRIDNVVETESQHVTATQVSSVQIAVLQEQVKEMKETMLKMDANQEKVLAKMDILLSGVSKDSKRWNQEMDKLNARTAKAEKDAKK